MALSSSHIQALDDILAKNDRVVGYSEQEQPEVGDDGRPTGTTGIRIYVDDLDAAKGTLPDAIAGKPVVEVVEIGRPERSFSDTAALGVDPKTRTRPLIGGISVSGVIAGGMTGTLGYFAKVTRTGETCLLTSNHILPTVGNDVIQPGLSDGGKDNPDNRVAKVIASVNSGPLGVDAAAAKIADTVPVTLTINDIGPVAGQALPEKDQKVEKSGRTTQHTTGKVTDPSATIDLGGISFRQQIVIVGDGGIRFSNKGDSGSLIVTADDHKAVGCLMADSAQVTVANPIAAVLAALSVELV